MNKIKELFVERMREIKSELAKKRKVVIIVVVIIVLFSWFQIRPAIIKHSCSWVHYDSPIYSSVLKNSIYIPVEERQAPTCEPYNPSIDDAKYSKWYNFKTGELYRPYTDTTQLPKELQQKINDPDCINTLSIIDFSSTIPKGEIIGTEKKTRKATEKEYSFCLHSHGL